MVTTAGSTLQGPPGPKGSPVLGNLREFRDDRLRYMRELASTYGDVVYLKLLRGEAFLLAHPDAIEEVLVKKKRSFRKARGTRALAPLLGNGLLVSEGDFWRRQRRLAQPAFHKERIGAYGAIMTEAGDRMLAGWKAGVPIDARLEMMRVTLDVAGRTLFNADVLDEASTVGDSLEMALAHFDWWSASGFLVPLWMPFKPNRRFWRARRELDKIVYDIIRERRAGGDDPGDLLSMLLSARDEDGSGMSDQQVRDEVMTLLLAGHETTANALTWAFVLLAQHPDVDARLAAEARRVAPDRNPTPADVPQLAYADMVVKEVLRLYPPAWIINYEATEDTTISGYPIRRGTTVFLSQWVTHRDPRWFPEPDSFRPERWGTAEIKQMPHFAYFPFGGGERMCIGRSFALLEAALLLAQISARYRLVLQSGQEVAPEPSVTLRPRGPVCMLPQTR
jgi:cytochrome P450